MDHEHYHDIGQYLRESRESLRISLSQAARDLHIREKYLKAIESGELSTLPGKTYTRGYINTYARYLRLDGDQVLARYEGLLGAKPQHFFTPEPSQRQNLPGGKLLILSVIGLLTIYGIWYFLTSADRALPPPVAQVPASFLPLLDKTPRTAMAKGWAECLDSGDIGCYTSLRARMYIRESIQDNAPTNHDSELYGIPITRIPLSATPAEPTPQEEP